MNTCGLTRLLGGAWLVGFAVSTIVGSSTSGWAAGLLTLMVVTVARRVRGTGRSCAIAPSRRAEVASGAATD